jgi:MFS family permease
MQVIGSPLAAALLSLDGLLGLQGWQWLFIVEGVPTVALGVYIHYTLPEGPATAAFLTAEERDWCLMRCKRVRLLTHAGRLRLPACPTSGNGGKSESARSCWLGLCAGPGGLRQSS